MKKAGFLTLLLAFLVVSCGVFASEADPVVIRIGDTVVLLSEAQVYFDELYARNSAFYTNYGQNIPAEDIAQIRDDIISELSQDALLAMKVKEFGFDEITEADRQAVWAEASASYEESARLEAEQRGVPVDQVKEERTGFGMTLEFEFENMLEMLPYTRLYNHVTEGVKVDGAALQKAYETYVQQDKELYVNDVTQFEFKLAYENANPLYRPEGYRAVNHILLPVPDALAFEIANAQADLLEIDDELRALGEELASIENGGQSTRTAEQVKADIEQKEQEKIQQEQVCEARKQQILPQIQDTIAEINGKLAAGESFAALAEQYGGEGSFQTQEDGTCFVHKESILFDAAFRDAAMAIANVGDFTLAVADAGVYVIQYVRDVAGGPVPMSDEIADMLRDMLLEDAKSAYYEEMFKQWQRENPVETHPELIVLPDLSLLPMEPAPDGTVDNPAEADGSIG